MTVRRRSRQTTTLRIEIGPKNTAWITEGARVVGLLNRLDVPRQWDTARRCWMVPARLVDDLLAHAEHEGRAVTVEATLI